MNALVSRVVAAVHHNAPNVLCFTCLARQEGVREHDVRAAALVLVMRRGLQLVERTCTSCQRADEVLMTRRAA